MRPGEKDEGGQAWIEVMYIQGMMMRCLEEGPGGLVKTSMRLGLASSGSE